MCTANLKVTQQWNPIAIHGSRHGHNFGQKTGNLLILLPVFLLLLLSAASAQAQQKIIKVGYSTGYGVISSSKAGDFSGYGYDYLQEIAKYTGWKYEFVCGSWSEGMERLKRGEIDLVGPIQYTRERAREYDYTTWPLGYEYGVLYCRADNTKLHYDSFAAFNGMKVGIVDNSFHNNAFETYRQKNGFTVNYVAFADAYAMMQAVERGEIDAGVCGSILEVKNVKLISKFSVEPFYIATSRGNKEIIDSFNTAMEKIRINNIYFDAALSEKYYASEAINQPAFTSEEAAFIQQSPTVKMAYMPDWKPIEYSNDSGVFDGINADLMLLLSRISGLQFSFVPMNYFEALHALKDKKIDLMSGYVSSQDEASSQIWNSVPYIRIPIVFVGTQHALPNENMRIALIENYPPLTNYLQQHYTDATLLPFENFNECLNAVRNGTVDATLLPSYMYDSITNDFENANLRLIAVTNLMFSMSVGVSSEQPAMLLSVINKALARISEKDLNECVFANTARTILPPALTEIMRRYALPLVCMIMLIGSLACTLYVSSKKKTENKLWRMAYIDDLTGHINWKKFEQDAKRLILQRAYVCIVLDIDEFKLINDYFGYSAGSNTLKSVADTINKKIRHMERFTRRNGDIFVLLLHYETKEKLIKRITDLQDALKKIPLKLNGEDKILHTACGIYVIHDISYGFNTMYDRANSARKSIKPVRETSYAFYDIDMRNRLLEEQDIEKHMEQALKDGEFVVYFQPKYDLKTEKAIGAEALVRWMRPEKGLLPPISFIPLFEKNGFVLKLDMFVLDYVCKKMREWLDKGFPVFPVSVNISKLHIQRTHFVRNVQDAVKLHDVPPHLIELEITETAFFDNTIVLRSTMQQLLDSGFILSMDDFGSGYSSLNMLKNIPVHVLKLDRAFFDMDEETERGRNIIFCIIQMAKALHMKVVSEGIETQDQINFLRQMDCDFVQGYYYDKPMNVEEFERKFFTDV